MIGAVSISLDFEAGWGAIGTGYWRRRELAGVYEAMRPTVRRFCALLEQHEINCLWAVVGGLIDTPGEWDINHLKGSYRARVEEFLREAKPTSQDGRDMLDIVRGTRVPQAFGTHSYSHLQFTDMEQNEGVVSADLERAKAVNKAVGIDARFLVFPENRVAHLQAVRRAGIEAARMPPRNAAGHGQERPFIQRAFDAAFRPVSVVCEEVTPEGLRLHYASELLNWGFNAGRAKKEITKRRIAKAMAMAERGHHVHFWLHPFNLVETEGLLAYIAKVLSDIARLRDAGTIEVRLP